MDKDKILGTEKILCRDCECEIGIKTKVERISKAGNPWKTSFATYNKNHFEPKSGSYRHSYDKLCTNCQAIKEEYYTREDKKAKDMQAKAYNDAMEKIDTLILKSYIIVPILVIPVVSC